MGLEPTTTPPPSSSGFRSGDAARQQHLIDLQSVHIHAAIIAFAGYQDSQLAQVVNRKVDQITDPGNSKKWIELMGNDHAKFVDFSRQPSDNKESIQHALTVYRELGAYALSVLCDNPETIHKFSPRLGKLIMDVLNASLEDIRFEIRDFLIEPDCVADVLGGPIPDYITENYELKVKFGVLD